MMALLILVLLSGCANAKSGNVDFFTIARKDSAPGITNRINEVITDLVIFDEFWNKIYRGLEGLPEVPKVDFAEKMVIAVSPGLMMTGGYNVEIVKVEEKVNWLEVTILAEKPNDSAIQSLAQPHHIIGLDKKTMPVVYKWVER
jgi:hypothetical protein